MNSGKINILLAEDDDNLSSLLKEYLEEKGFLVKRAKNGKEGYDLFCKQAYDLCLLDVMMPHMDGITLAKKIRVKSKKIPVIFITANATKADTSEAFDIGADDYITKPFNMEELLARINAVLRRSVKIESINIDIVEFAIGKYIFNSEKQTLKSIEDNFRLTNKESQLLRLLLLNKNELLDRSYALKTIWHDTDYFKGRSMDVYITKLRKYLKNDPNVEILNEHAKGFKLFIKS